MEPLELIDVATIRRMVAHLYATEAPPFTSAWYLMPIDPSWLETPERRFQLWAMLERLERLDQGG
jgi:hypothetical protein